MARRTLALLLLVALLLATPAQAGSVYLPLVLRPGATWYASVTRVVDGDTIDVSLCGMTLRVRYIGIDTPECGHCYYAEATARNSEFVKGKTVLLVRDVSETDSFGRLLRYVYLGDTFINAELVRGGYARADPFPPDVRFADLFSDLEKEAQLARRGLLGGLCNPNPDSHPHFFGSCLSLSRPFVVALDSLALPRVR